MFKYHFHLPKSVADWLKTGLAAIIGAAATVLSTGVTNPHKIGLAALVAVGMYLKKTPVPPAG